MKNTLEQDKAIESIDQNISVNAGAGTGKTTVLTERFIYILENGNLEKGREIESIVAITFTKKASQEMKERIRGLIQTKSLEDQEWARLYRDMEKANISTIHSFCGNILRENSIAANIDPLFTVTEQEEADRLLEDTILDLLLKGIEEDDKVFNLLTLFGQDDFTSIIKELKDFYRKIRTLGMSIEEIETMTLDIIDRIKVEIGDLDYIKDTFKYLMSKSGKNSKFNKLKDKEVWHKFLQDEYEEGDLIPILEELYDNIGSNKKEAETIDELKAFLENIFWLKEREHRWAYEAVFSLIWQIDRDYGRKKDELGVLDYDDLQILTLELLDQEEIRQEYQDKYKYIMVDEFQDTNELQKKIFYRLSSKEDLLDRENLFVVGDPKQSIYGFRGADLGVFYDVMEDMEKLSGVQPIILGKNFRTVDTVLNMVNDLFGKIMGEDYDALSPNELSENPIDVEILENPDLDIPKGVSPSDYHSYYESRLIASRIKELVESKVYNYGDFALLFRSSKEDYIYEDALIDYDIPFYNVSGKGFYHRQEIIDVINGLKAIANSYDTIALIGLLRSPMVGLSDTSIYWLLRFREENLYKTLAKEIAHIEEGEKEKIANIKAILDKLIIRKDLQGIYENMEELINKTYYKESLLMEEGGRQALANLYKLLDKAREFDREGGGSIEDFIDHMEEIKNSDESQAKIETENANVVKLMTIHKSKGLEFPVVVLPQLARRFNYSTPRLLIHKDIGMGIRYDSNSPLYQDIRRDYLEEDMEENKRILYVAMTRAEKALILARQGGNQGFKAMIKDQIDPQYVRKIGEISQEGGQERSIELIDQDKISKSSSYLATYPLLEPIEAYGKRTFNNFNISQFLDYRQCPRQFYMKYCKSLALEGEGGLDIGGQERGGQISRLDPLTKGNLIHAFTEHYNSSVEAEELLEKLVPSFGLDYNPSIKKELMPYINNYLKYHREDYDEIHMEKEFFIKIGEDFIRGKIDRINIKNNQGEIIDFKTNKVDNRDKLVNYYSPQLQFYTWVVEEIMNIKVRNARLAFLETGELVEVDISPQALKGNQEDIRDFINFVKEHNSLDSYQKGQTCPSYCNYSLICN